MGSTKNYWDIGMCFSEPVGDDWSRISQFASMIYYHTFTLPFQVMTWPGGVCFSDGFGGLECRLSTLHSLLIEDGCITRILLETKDGMFSSKQDIFDHVICQKPFMEYIVENDANKDVKDEFAKDPDDFILQNLLPCIKVGKAYVSGWDNNDRDGTVCLMHALRPFYDGPCCVEKESTTIRTKFVLHE